MSKFAIDMLNGPIIGAMATGSQNATTGVLVLAGSSGRVDIQRAELFASAGTKALALQWFGGPHQTPGICEVPLETFILAIDYLAARGCQRFVIVGTSKGAEAALLVSIIDPRVDLVVAISPSSVVWGNVGPGIDGVSWPERSSWSFEGKPYAFVPADPELTPRYRDGLVSYRSLFEHCLQHEQNAIESAVIPVEKTSAHLILVAGGDDALWPSDIFARQISERRQRHGLSVELVFDAEAGHRVLLPGETTPRSTKHAHGGTDAADSALGNAAWQAIVKHL
ncbi:acyl-CoA thioester hydrolase/BAAT C-terminal domain-containing protein [Oryzifoliimicrobium ureilyticus]|uniref:acyl-CoA thioester hydrolase/BAAT C-terminal domain-containing protein n=1 Tax=Oryzifoliimicrobium ureilyticus TaxID=3113724 RepID=UPI003F6775F1